MYSATFFTGRDGVASRSGARLLISETKLKSLIGSKPRFLYNSGAMERADVAVNNVYPSGAALAT